MEFIKTVSMVILCLYLSYSSGTDASVTSDSVVLSSVPNNASIKVGGIIWFICNAGSFNGPISRMEFRRYSPLYDNFSSEVPQTLFNKIGTLIYSNVSLHLHSNNVSCIITDVRGNQYCSESILIVVEREDATVNVTPELTDTTMYGHGSSSTASESNTDEDSITPTANSVSRGGDNRHIIAIIIGAAVALLIIAMVVIIVIIIICHQNFHSSIKSICCGFKISVAFGFDNSVPAEKKEVDQAQIGNAKFAGNFKEEGGMDRNSRTITSRKTLPRNWSSVARQRDFGQMVSHSWSSSAVTTDKDAKQIHDGDGPEEVNSTEEVCINIAEQKTEAIPDPPVGPVMVVNAKVHPEPVNMAAEGSNAGDEFKDVGNGGDTDMVQSDEKKDDSVLEHSNVTSQCVDQLGDSISIGTSELVGVKTSLMTTNPGTQKLHTNISLDDLCAMPENPQYIFSFYDIGGSNV